MKRAVFQINIQCDNDPKRIGFVDYCTSTVQTYAQRIGADYVVVENFDDGMRAFIDDLRNRFNIQNGFLMLNLYKIYFLVVNLIDRYDQITYLDYDLAISKRSSDLMSQYSDKGFHAFRVQDKVKAILHRQYLKFFNEDFCGYKPHRCINGCYWHCDKNTASRIRSLFETEGTFEFLSFFEKYHCMNENGMYGAFTDSDDKVGRHDMSYYPILFSLLGMEPSLIVQRGLLKHVTHVNLPNTSFDDLLTHDFLHFPGPIKTLDVGAELARRLEACNF